MYTDSFFEAVFINISNKNALSVLVYFDWRVGQEMLTELFYKIPGVFYEFASRLDVDR